MTTNIDISAFEARIAELEAQNAALRAHVPALTGSFNPSKPFADGRMGSKYFGTVHLADGKSYNVDLYERTNSKTGEVFLSLVCKGEYVKDKAA